VQVVVAHPGIQHSHQLAQALHRSGRLSGFWSSVPVRNAADGLRDPWNLFGTRLRGVAIPSGLRSHPVRFAATDRIAGKLLAQLIRRQRINHILNLRFDRWVADRIAKSDADAVVAYEGSSETTFARAKMSGITTILDAASICELSTPIDYEHTKSMPSGTDILSIKHRELLLADFVFSCSKYAANSYIAVGFPKDRVLTLPLGTEVDHAVRAKVAAEFRTRFVFVGSVRIEKGVDLLLQAFDDPVLAQHATLHIVGAATDRALIERAKANGSVRYVGMVERDVIHAEMAKYDCLVLPSRRDGFGMVVAEAMSVGLPVIVSNQTGASCIVEEFPEAGRITDCDVYKLREALLRAATDKQWLQRASITALTAAQAYSWDAYARNVDRAFVSIERMLSKNRDR
jgi:glycosyltransferase involved in cell wall biosynthesis